MKTSRQLGRKATVAVIGAAVLVFATLVLKSGSGEPANARPPQGSAPSSNTNTPDAVVELTPSHLNAIQIEPVGTCRFPVEKEAVGNIALVDDLTVQVFPPYAGKLIKTLVELGDAVQKGQPLYTIHSPDLIQAGSTLIGAAATFDLTSKELARARALSRTKGISEREMEQAVSDQQTAEGALKAARDAVRLFGKTETEVDRIIAARRIDPALVVSSPVTGEVTAFSAPPGLFVQPGTAPAPLSVSDTSVKWMVGNVTESDSPDIHLGQPVEVTVAAYPGRVFKGRIIKIGATVDPNTHRVMIRSEIADPKHELRSGMLANFTIQIREPVESIAIPVNGVVRNGDGTMAAWVTSDRRKFTRRLVKVGLERDGRRQVLAGLQRGELAVTEGAVFLSNMLEAPPTD
jgi:membrane fusion protein, heavy metal efflux system